MQRPATAASLLVLIHSPLVGPLTWQAVADELRDRGHGVVVPSLLGVFDASPPYYPRLAAEVADAIREVWTDGPVTLVAHSGAGALMPAVTEELGGRTHCAI